MAKEKAEADAKKAHAKELEELKAIELEAKKAKDQVQAKTQVAKA